MRKPAICLHIDKHQPPVSEHGIPLLRKKGENWIAGLLFFERCAGVGDMEDASRAVGDSGTMYTHPSALGRSGLTHNILC